MADPIDPSWDAWGAPPPGASVNASPPASSTQQGIAAGWDSSTTSQAIPLSQPAQQIAAPPPPSNVSSQYDSRPPAQLNNAPPISSFNTNTSAVVNSPNPSGFHSAQSGSQTGINTWKPLIPSSAAPSNISPAQNGSSFNNNSSVDAVHPSPPAMNTQNGPSNNFGWSKVGPSSSSISTPASQPPTNEQNIAPPPPQAAPASNNGWITSVNDVKPFTSSNHQNSGVSPPAPPSSIAPAPTSAATNDGGWTLPTSTSTQSSSFSANDVNGTGNNNGNGTYNQITSTNAAHFSPSSKSNGFQSGAVQPYNNGGNTSGGERGANYGGGGGNSNSNDGGANTSMWGNSNGGGNGFSNGFGNGGAGGGGNAGFGQERRGPPTYAFSIPSECRGYVIGSGGANLQRISDETGCRVTRGKPKQDGSDPNDRDFLIFNDDNLPNDKFELALVKIIAIVRRKIGDWLPTEGKAGEDASRLLSEGKVEDRSGGGGYGSRNTYGNENGGSYGDRSNAGYQTGPTTPGYQNGPATPYNNNSNGYRQPANATVNGTPAQYNGASNVSAPSSPIDTFPTQPGPFKDPTSPVKIPSNWGQVPPPTFSPGPRSTVSHYSARDSNIPAPPYNNASSSNVASPANVGQWKPAAPSFVPRTQAGYSVTVEPNESKVSLSAFLQSGVGSKWVAENIPPSARVVTLPQQQTYHVESSAPVASSQSVNVVNGEAPAAVPAPDGWGAWKPAAGSAAIVNPPSSSSTAPAQVQAPPTFTQPSHTATPYSNQTAVNGAAGPSYASSIQPPASATGNESSFDPPSVGWKVKTSSNSGIPASVPASSNINNHAPTTTASGWTLSSAGNANENTTSAPARETTPRPSAHQQGGWTIGPASQAADFSNAAPPAPQPAPPLSSGSPHDRTSTHDSGFSQGQAPIQPIPVSQGGGANSGWVVKGSSSVGPAPPANPIASLSNGMANMQVSGPTANGFTSPETTQNHGYGTAQDTATPASNTGWKPRAFNGVLDDAQPSQAPQASQAVNNAALPTSGGLGWDDPAPSAGPLPAATSAPAPQAVPAINGGGGGGLGWDDAPSSAAQASKAETGGWNLPGSSSAPVRPQNTNTNNGFSSSRSNFEDAAETVRPSDSISNVNVNGGDSRSTVNGHTYGSQNGARSTVNGHTNGYQNQNQSNGYSPSNPTGNANGYGHSNGQANGYSGGGNANGYGSNSYGNIAQNGYGGGGGASNNYSSGGGGGGYNSGGGGNEGFSSSGNNGYGSGGGYGGGYGGGGGGPPQERRFAGPNGSWATGANDVPLRQNRWVSQAGRRPGDDVHRPAVPQAIPGSGW